MKQTRELDNACGIIAALHAIYNNIGDQKITLLPDSVLASFLDSVNGVSPDERAAALENYTAFKEQYRATASQGQSSQSRSTTHHYTAFIVNEANQLVELCGCKEGPLVVAENCTDVLKGTADEVMRRLQAGEITEAVSVLALTASQD